MKDEDIAGITYPKEVLKEFYYVKYHAWCNNDEELAKLESELALTYADIEVKNTKLLVMCSTKRRPKLLLRMLESFIKTRSGDSTKMIIYISRDDPCLKEYAELMDKFDVNWFIGENRTMVEVLNFFSTQLYPNIPFYCDVNDDHEYITEGWDEKLMNVIKDKGKGWGIACPNDLVPRHWEEWQHPSAVMLSGNIVRMLGYYIFPGLNHMYSDDYQRDLGAGIDRLFHVPEVIIKHHHWRQGDRPKDDNDKWIKGDYEHGRDTHRLWKNLELGLDLAKLKMAIRETSDDDNN